MAHARVTAAELAEWRTKAAAGVTLSELRRRAMRRPKRWRWLRSWRRSSASWRNCGGGRTHLKFLSRGTGSATGAVRYLLGERDHSGEPRQGVEVLRGNPDDVAAVADSLEHKHRYTSGVLAWVPEDKPTEEQIGQALDEFEKLAWAGLKRDRDAWTAVLHREGDGGVHVHVLAARCDLETGKSLNIAPPGWQKTFDPLRDWPNTEHGWSRRDDPEQARSVQPGPYRAYVDKAAVRAALAVEPDPRQQITHYLLQGITEGVIEDRSGVVEGLKELGLEIPRQGRNYVTALDPESGQRWRLKGAIYEQEFQADQLAGRETKEEGRGAGAGDRGSVRAPDAADRGASLEAAAAARAALGVEIRRRAEYHRARYGSGHESSGRDASEGLDAPAGGGHRNRDRPGAGELGPGAVAVGADREPGRDQGGPGDRTSKSTDGRC